MGICFAASVTVQMMECTLAGLTALGEQGDRNSTFALKLCLAAY
jgi:hypothetical protein